MLLEEQEDLAHWEASLELWPQQFPKPPKESNSKIHVCTLMGLKEQRDEIIN